MRTQFIKIEGEEWADIPEFEGLYMVSSLGRIRSLPAYGQNL